MSKKVKDHERRQVRLALKVPKQPYNIDSQVYCYDAVTLALTLPKNGLLPSHFTDDFETTIHTEQQIIHTFCTLIPTPK